MKVYIAGPMAGHMDGQNYRTKIKEILKKYGVEYICPMELDFNDLGKEETLRVAEVGNGKVNHSEDDIDIIKKMVERDLRAIDECSVLIAYTPYPSYGTDMEIFYHSYIKEKVTIILSENPKSWVLGLGDFFVKNYDELDALIFKLLQIEHGE